MYLYDTKVQVHMCTTYIFIILSEQYKYYYRNNDAGMYLYDT